MPVNVIGTLKPKNNGKFPVAEAVDIKVTGDLRLDEALENKADNSTVNFVLDQKADKTITTGLQAQINEIITPVTEDAEVQNARVGADGTSYSTLKERIDTENANIKGNLNELVIDGNSIERGSYSNGVKGNENKRLRSITAIYVNKGDLINFTSETLYYNAVIYSEPPSDVQQNSVEDSGWISDNYLVKNNGYLVFLFANGSTYGTSTDITVSDYDANTCVIKDVFEVDSINQSINNLTGETEELQKVTYQIAKNLIPYNTTDITPCFIPANSTITISTADGQTLGVSGGVDIRLYDKDKIQINYWHWSETSTKRTIETASTAYYISLSKAIEREIQVELGGTATEYEPYNKNLLGSIYDLYSITDSFTSIISKKMSDYPVEMGTIDGGRNGTSTRRIRTVGYVAISGKCNVKSTSGSNVAIALYNEDKSYIEGINWTSVASVNNENVKYIRITARKASNNPDIDESEVEEISNTVIIERPLSEGAYSSSESDEELGANNSDFALNAIRKTASANYSTFTLLHFSDLHGSATRLQTIINFYNKNKIRYNIQDALLTGDIVFQKYSNGMDWFDAVEDSENILLAIGNHDTTEGTTDYETNDHTQAELWSRYFETRISNWNVENTSGNTYYYKDYINSGIRLIVINSMLLGDDATAQNTWLTAVLADAITNNLSVVIGCHYRSNGAIKVDSNFTDYNKVLNDYYKNNLSAATMGIVQDFIDNNGEFVCYICGHMHTDVIGYNKDYPDQLFVAVTDAYGWTNYDSDLDRVHEPDAFNLFFVDKSNHTFKIIRIGANCDSYLRTRNCISVDYNSKDIISMQ